MISNVDKNIILIKNIPSNMIEEAIFILKENCNDKMSEIQLELAKSESELILQNYIDEEVIKTLKNKIDKEKKNGKRRILFCINICVICFLIINILK